MAFTDKAEFNVPRHIVQKGAVNIETITADKTLTYADSTYQILTNSKGSEAVVTLPALKDGAHFFITCSAASGHTIEVQDADGGTVIGTPNLGGGKGSLIVCDGSAWAVVIEQV